MEDQPVRMDEADVRDVAGNSNGMSRTKYKKRKGCSNEKERKELEYEFKLCVWFLICALKNPCINTFSLASNLQGAGSFHDIVIKYTCSDTDNNNKHVSRRCFIHTNVNYGKKFKISKGHFSDNEDFNIDKLYLLFLERQANYSSETNQEIFGDMQCNDSYIIFTNVEVDNFLDDDGGGVLSKSDSECILCRDINTGSIFSIHKSYFGNGKEVQLFSSQANLHDLDCNIKRGIVEICNCSDDMADLIWLDIYRNRFHFFGNSDFITNREARKLLLDTKENVCSKIDIEFVNGCSSIGEPIDKDTQYYMQIAMKNTLSHNDLRLLNNFQSVKTVPGNGNLFTFNYGSKVFRSEQKLMLYYTALWFTYNFSTNRKFLLRKFFMPDFKIIKHEFDEILADGFDLHNAVLKNNKAKVQSLLNSTFDVNSQDKGGRTSLHLVAIQGENVDPIITRLLLDHSADVYIVDNVFQWTPLKYADSTCSWSTIALILEHGGSINDLIFTSQVIPTRGHEALLSALRVGADRFVHFLVENGINVHRTLTDDGLTPLHIAAQYCSKNTVKLLVDNGANFNVPDCENRTPLYYACFRNDKNIVKYLRKKGAVSLTI